jgi:hypothetical protein
MTYEEKLRPIFNCNHCLIISEKQGDNVCTEGNTLGLGAETGLTDAGQGLVALGQQGRKKIRERREAGR